MLYDLDTNTDFKSVRSRVFMPVNGKLDPLSYEEFENSSSAIAYWWAMAKSKKQGVGYMLIGGEGYVSNVAMRHKMIPKHMIQEVSAHVSNMDRGADSLRIHRIRMEKTPYGFAGFSMPDIGRSHMDHSVHF